MKFSIEAKVLAKAMKAAASILESSAILPILGNVRLYAAGDALEITTCDLENEYRQRLPIKAVKEELATTVDAKRLLAIANVAPLDATLNLSLSGGRMTITAGKSRWVISTLPADDFPMVNGEGLGPVLEIEGALLAGAIRRVEWAISDEKTQSHLCGAWLHDHEGKVCFAAAQRSGCAVAELDAAWPGDAVNVMICAKFAGVLASLAESAAEPVKLAWDGRKCRAEIDSCILTGKLIDSQFVDYRRVIPAEGNAAIIDPDSMADGMKRVLILAAQKTRTVKIERGDGKITLHASDGNANVSQEEIPATCEAGFTAGINGAQFMEAMAAIGGETIEIHQADHQSAILLRRTVADGALAVVMPMRI